MNEEESKIKQQADLHAKAYRKSIARDIADKEKYPPELYPVSVFMAGSPGAGKTESAKWLVTELSGDENGILRIDTDEFRKHFSGYTGENSKLFQYATTLIAEKVHDYAIANEQSFVFDGTFSKLEIARKNILRSISHKRPVQILYVYQDPLQAWEFVKERAIKDGRHVPKEAFIEQYFSARKTVNSIKKEFPEVKVYLLVKNIDGSTQEYKENIDSIDNYLKETYTIDTLESMLL